MRVCANCCQKWHMDLLVTSANPDGPHEEEEEAVGEVHRNHHHLAPRFADEARSLEPEDRQHQEEGEDGHAEISVFMFP